MADLDVPMNKITGLLAALDSKRNNADPILMAEVEGLAAALAEIEPIQILSRGTIAGLRVSNNISSPNTHFDVAAGSCRSSDDTEDITLVTGMTKSLASIWSAGSNLGARDTAAAIQSNTGYHVYVMKNPTTGEVDIAGSTSATNPALPSGYTKFRRIWSLLTDGSGLIRRFTQKGNYCQLHTRTTDYAATSNGGGPNLRTLTVPQGRKYLLDLYFQSTGTASTYLSGIYDPDDGAPYTFGGSAQWAQIRRQAFKDASDNPISYVTTMVRQWCNSNKQVYTYSSDSSDVIVLGVVGWFDDRDQYV